MKNKNIFIIATILLIGLAFFFGSKTSRVLDNKQDSSQILSQVNPSPATLLNKQAPDFQLTTLDGQVFKLSDKRGKTVILFGMAGWCGTCIPEGKALTNIKQEYAAKGVEIIGVAFTKGDNNDFLNEYKKIGGIDIPVALDTDNVAQKYNLTRLETTYLINKEGGIVYKDERTTSYEEYKQELDKIL